MNDREGLEIVQSTLRFHREETCFYKIQNYQRLSDTTRSPTIIIMNRTTPKRTPTPGKRVTAESDISVDESCPAKRALFGTPEKKERDPNVLNIAEVKKLNFSLQDYSYKVFAKVVCLGQPREHKSQDVHYHRRPFILADHSDFIKGFIRSNDDNVMELGLSYYFSEFKMFRKAELLIHETSTVWE